MFHEATEMEDGSHCPKFRFWNDGQPLKDDDTAKALELQDDDIIFAAGCVMMPFEVLLMVS